MILRGLWALFRLKCCKIQSQNHNKMVFDFVIFGVFVISPKKREKRDFVIMLILLWFCYSFCYGFRVTILPFARSSTLKFNALQILITLLTLELPIPLRKILSSVVYGISAAVVNSLTLLYLERICSFNLSSIVIIDTSFFDWFLKMRVLYFAWKFFLLASRIILN